ncbi:MAG TPA: flagellar hook-basal body protein [Solirubrobacteraceae bacterium]|jgi:flagellar basal-body rod protein FlgG|nr:flagellar hook-basal body protein [Solirubrobacteraceae bacterium]
MLEGLYSAAAGMSAQQEQLDAIGNDLANESTTGYKSERFGFRDLLYSQVEQVGTTSATVGAGAGGQVIGRDGSQGAIQQTGDPLDLAIEGEGYFQVKRPGGQISLTRGGAFGVDASGQLTAHDGSLLSPPITIPRGVSAGEVSIAQDGTVSAHGRRLGQIALVTVASPDHLLADGAGGLSVTAASGPTRPVSGAHIVQGALESSNVDLAGEMSQMMITQRAFQLTSTAIHTQAQMLSIANQLRA